MYNSLQPTALVPFESNVERKTNLKQPAVVISMVTPADRLVASNNGKIPELVLPFEDWKMPKQEQGYLKADKHTLF